MSLPATAGTPPAGQLAKEPSLMAALVARMSRAKATSCVFIVL